MAYRPSESGMFTPTSMLTTAPDDTGEGFSVIDRHSNFDGTFVAKRDLRIEGEVKGRHRLQRHAFYRPGCERQRARRSGKHHGRRRIYR